MGIDNGDKEKGQSSMLVATLCHMMIALKPSKLQPATATIGGRRARASRVMLKQNPGFELGPPFSLW